MSNTLEHIEQQTQTHIDPHRNIFYYYRGPRLKNSDEFPYDTQLENNTTKSLINVLELCRPTTALDQFLKMLSTKMSQSQVSFCDLIQTNRKCRFALQSIPPTVSEAKHRVLVTITGATGAVEQTASGQVGGRPDAWILSGMELAMMIECKLSSSINEKQLQGHLGRVGWSEFTRIDIHWQDVYHCMEATLAKVKEGKDRFMIRQFLDYLEVIGMSPFSGFRNFDFDLFISYHGNEEYRPVVRRKLTEYAQAVYNHLPQNIRHAYPDFYPGRMGRGGMWIGFRKKQSSSNPLRHCNFTIEISADGLRFCAVIRDGRSVDVGKPIGILYRKLNDTIGFRSFHKMLTKLGKYYSIVIYRRTNKSGEDRIIPGQEEWHKKACIYLDAITEEGLQYVIALIRKIKYPGIQVQADMPRGDRMLTKPEDLVREGVTTIDELYPVLRFLEE